MTRPAFSAAVARYEEAVRGFIELLRRAAPAEAALPETIGETLIGGVAWIVSQQIGRGDAERARDLQPELSEFLHSPYHGVEIARSEPRGESDSTVADSNA